MDKMTAESLKDDFQAIVENEGKGSIKQIRNLMKKTGLSYGQIMKEVKRVVNDLRQAEKDAEEKGEVFDRKKYIEDLAANAVKGSGL